MCNSKVRKAERINERLDTRIIRLFKRWYIFDLLITIAWYSIHIAGILFGVIWIVVLTAIAIKVVY